LALSLPSIASKPMLIDLTYAVVVFSVLVQAPTLKLLFPDSLLQRIVRAAA
jgi:NhaP-type Na+/H+ or K+/H+ antiporter